jgi:hypothetical protein
MLRFVGFQVIQCSLKVLLQRIPDESERFKREDRYCRSRGVSRKISWTPLENLWQGQAGWLRTQHLLREGTRCETYGWG